MFTEALRKELETLFTEKKYEEVIKISEEKINQNEIPASLSNLIGVCKILKKERSLEDVSSALTYFEGAYIKGKKTIHGLNGLTHLISIGLQFLKENRNLSRFILKAEKFYLESESLFKKNEIFLSSGLSLYSHLLDEKKQKKIFNEILNSASKSKVLRSTCLFEKNYFNDWSQKNHFENAIINSKYFSKLEVKTINKLSYNQNEKINLGFVSCDFERNHSIIFFIKDTIKHLDKKRFRIHLFSFAKENTKDESQNDLKNLSDEWFNLNQLDNQKVVNLIQKKKINILFDVMGFTNPNRLEIFNSRVAPIQISWLAYCNTIGFETIDYIMIDKNLVIKDEEKFYLEKVIRLPKVWNSHAGFNLKRKYNKLPCEKDETFTLGSFNNFRKISVETVDTWSSILQSVSNSRLILKSSTFCDTNFLLDKFKKNGVENKVKILDKVNFHKKKNHLELYNKVDLALDTFPYNGVTTTFEALWMNVPVIVLKGYNFNSRCGESIIKNTKIDYLIASNTKEYIQKVIFLSQNRKKLNEMRRELYDEVLSTPLFDTKSFAKDFGDCLLKVLNN
jgi:predicted O-linked N-acetylglucosamine transferase (SPINDLY family)